MQEGKVIHLHDNTVIIGHQNLSQMLTSTTLYREQGTRPWTGLIVIISIPMWTQLSVSPVCSPISSLLHPAVGSGEAGFAAGPAGQLSYQYCSHGPCSGGSGDESVA